MSTISVILLIIVAVFAVPFVCIPIAAVRSERREKKAFDELKIGDVYVSKSDAGNPFLNHRRYIRVTKKSDASGVRWVEYKSIFGGVVDDLKWERFYSWYVKEHRTEDEIRKAVAEYERSEK